MDYTQIQQMTAETCCKCGMAFGMPLDYQNRRRNDHKDFFCPAGHPQHYTGKTTEQQLREEVERKQQVIEAERARADKMRRQRDDIGKAHTRMRARVMNGVCPCCNRTFQNLMAHMKTEHAEDGASTLKVLRQSFGMTQAQLAEEIGVSTATVSNAEHGNKLGATTQRIVDLWIERQHA